MKKHVPDYIKMGSNEDKNHLCQHCIFCSELWIVKSINIKIQEAFINQTQTIKTCIRFLC